MATKTNLKPVVLENAQIFRRNFSGQPGPFNEAGVRSFLLFLDPDDAKNLLRDGWNVKFLTPRDDAEEGEEQRAYLPIKVKFGTTRPPKIAIVTSKNKTFLDESELAIADWAEIKKVDLIINPSAYNVNGSSGIAAYLKSIFITVVEDQLDEKYADVPDSAQSSMGVQFEPTENTPF